MLAAAVIRIEATIAFYAYMLAALGDVDDEDRRRRSPSLSARTKVTPDRRFSLGFDPSKLLPTVTPYLHLYAGKSDTAAGVNPDDIGSVARSEGEGPITAQYVRDVLGPHARCTIKPVLNPAGLAPVDGYEIPDRHWTTPSPTDIPTRAVPPARPVCTTSDR